MSELNAQVEVPVTTPLRDLLIERILREGPITFHDWMQSALYDPANGYYMRATLQRWGREGDYRTSPERTELFATTFAKYFSHLYEKLHRPQQFIILECGAGDGSFALDVLSFFRDRVPGLFGITRYLVDESSADSRDRIRKKLAGFKDRVEFVSLFDIARLDSAVVFSNELLDAFPVHRLQLVNGELRELYVSVDSEGEFVWIAGELSKPWLENFVSSSSLQLIDTQIIEVSPWIESWFEALGQKLQRGYVVTVDYGNEATELYDFNQRPEGTLRAYSRHQFENVLDSPGEFDITTSVDWSYIKRGGAANGLTVIDFDRLDQFLMKSGLLDELTAKLESLTSDSEKLKLTTAAREMILPGGMASSFQVLVQSRD
jgi:SAM-dependent MidA family methyltransferase